MKIAVVGAGPAGLFFSLLLKRKRPEHEIAVLEQNPRGATFGFGVVFSRGALEFLARDEPAMHARLSAARVATTGAKFHRGKVLWLLIQICKRPTRLSPGSLKRIRPSNRTKL